MLQRGILLGLFVMLGFSVLAVDEQPAVEPPRPPPEPEQAPPKERASKPTPPARELKANEMLYSDVIKVGELQRKARIEEIDADLKRYATASKEFLAGRTAKRKMYADLKSRYVPRLTFEAGGVGTLRGWDEEPAKITVAQVVDAENVICTLNYGGRNAKDLWVWMQKIATDGMVDDANISKKLLTTVFRCVGTKQYDTAVGSTKTVHLIEQVNVVQDAK